jgi:hypothetical protein
MSQPTPFTLSQRFSRLIGRKVTFTQAAAVLDTKVKQAYGIYKFLPNETPIVVQADLRLLGSFAGSLVGLPDAVVTEHLRTMPIEELLRDAINEVLNIASAAIADEGRVVFSKMVTDAVYVDGDAGVVLKKPHHRSYFTVTIEGYQGGRFCIFAPFNAGKVVTF